MPLAKGHAPGIVTLVQKIDPKIHHVGGENPPNLVQNWLKSLPRSLLGGSWGHLGPKRAPRAKKAPKYQRWLRPFGGQVGAKIDQKSILRPSRKSSFFCWFSLPLFCLSWGQLGASWGHLGGILGSSWGILGHFGGILKAFCFQIKSQVDSYMQFCWYSKNLKKHKVF